QGRIQFPHATELPGQIGTEDVSCQGIALRIVPFLLGGFKLAHNGVVGKTLVLAVRGKDCLLQIGTVGDHAYVPRRPATNWEVISAALRVTERIFSPAIWRIWLCPCNAT